MEESIYNTDHDTILMSVQIDDDTRELMQRLYFTPELCEEISCQRNSNSTFSALSPLDVAISLGMGRRVYVKEDQLLCYRLLNGALEDCL